MPELGSHWPRIFNKNVIFEGIEYRGKTSIYWGLKLFDLQNVVGLILGLACLNRKICSLADRFLRFAMGLPRESANHWFSVGILTSDF